MSGRLRIFRWRAVGPLLVLLALLGVLWLLFGDLLLRQTAEDAGTDLLGTEVDIAGLHLRESQSSLEIGRLQVADPFDSLRNLIETGAIRLELDPAALLEKKLVVNRLELHGLRFGTRRETAARRVSGNGFAPRLVSQMNEWSRQFNVPLLQLTPIDTVRQLALHPEQLTTVRRAEALAGTVDSTQRAFRDTLAAINPERTLDSARALIQRLSGATAASLGVPGLRQAATSVKNTLDELNRLDRQLKSVQGYAEAGAGAIQAGLTGVRQGLDADYAFARGLLQVPSLRAPDIGSALFGPVSIDRFRQVTYWAELAQHYLPPGLQPRARPAAGHLRRGGTTVSFPKKEEYPAFLLRQGALDLTLGQGKSAGSFALSVQGLTTQPSVYGRPAVIRSQGAIGGASPVRLGLTAVLDHTGREPSDSLQLDVSGVPLPAVTLPGLPFRAEPEAGRSSLGFLLRGDQLNGRLSLRADRVAWRADTTGGTTGLQRMVWEVVRGLAGLQVSAQVTGALHSPSLSVSSNLDQALAARLQAVLGEQVAGAEARARRQVDSLVAGRVTPVRARADSVRVSMQARTQELQQQVQDLKVQLQSRLKSLTGGLGGLLQ